MGDPLSERDLDQLDRVGISPEELERQLALFREAPRGPRLLRPCRPGDGIRVLEESESGPLLEAWADAAERGRFTKFVPASGAATRMFSSLQAFLDAPDGPAAPDAVAFRDDFARLPFSQAIDARRDDGGGDPTRGLIRAVLSPEGLGYLAMPKGLIPFHRAADGFKTPFEEHLCEGAATVRARDGRCRIHFTVSPDQEDAFRRLLETRRAALEAKHGVSFDVTFSVQHASTDTVAVDLENRPFRLADGSLFFRPGGHGALLRNLSELHADLVYVKNVDNVVPESRLPLVVRWKKLLGGLLVLLERKAHALLGALEAPGCPGSVVLEAATFVESSFGVPPPPGDPGEGACRTLRRRLDRPIRVCGVVRNQGEPGGGPFWVAAPSGGSGISDVSDVSGVSRVSGVSGVSAQIVESSQIDASDPSQRTVWESSTHFNPVDLVLALRDHRGEPFDLERFVDPSTVFISRKSRDGRELKALERPGLWNGAMAGWNTLFVEVPGETFAPVKTVLDLLRPEHQP